VGVTRARVRILGRLAVVETEDGGVALVPAESLDALAEKLGLCYENWGEDRCSW
jgi:hypothetical protein